MKALVAIAFAVVLILMVRRRLLQVDMSFPLFLALVVLALASTNERFINGIAGFFGIVYEPLAVILFALFIVVALVTVVVIGLSHLRDRQRNIVRRLVARDLSQQESRLVGEA